MKSKSINCINSYISLFFFILPVLFSCKNKENRLPVGSTAKQTAVCIVNEISVRDSPSIESKWFKQLTLGECVTYLGEQQSDASGNSQIFLKVQLSDGRTGWIKSYALLLDARPAAVISESPVYSNPNPSYFTKQKVYPLEFAAIVEEKSGWIKFVAKERKITGWLPVSTISNDTLLVAISARAESYLLDANGQPVPEKIQGFLQDNQIQNTVFYKYLSARLDAEVEQAIGQSIEQYENK